MLDLGPGPGPGPGLSPGPGPGPGLSPRIELGHDERCLYIPDISQMDLRQKMRM